MPDSAVRPRTKAVWKFALPLDHRAVHSFHMPVGAQMLAVQAQDNMPTIWALVDPNPEHHEIRKFKIVGTGHVDVHGNDSYVGTVQTAPFVWHVFEILP